MPSHQTAMAFVDSETQKTEAIVAQSRSWKKQNTGEFNFMSIKGRQAFLRYCDYTSVVKSCQDACDSYMEFFDQFSEEDCSTLERDDWKEECVKVARGELRYEASYAEKR